MREIESGRAVPMSEFAGNVCLVVNVASQCGLTGSNYEELAELHSKYAARGLAILAFPCAWNRALSLSLSETRTHAF